MFEGVLITESLRPGITLDGIQLMVTKISKTQPQGTTASQPTTWTLLEFAVEDDRAVTLAEMLSHSLVQPGWYADFRSERETFVIYPGRIFRYRRGDAAARAEAQEHGRRLDIPEAQLDWAV